MKLLVSAKTDIGRTRKTNQDAFYCNEKIKFFLVADGMGGHNGGDIASQMATQYVSQYLLQHPLSPTACENTVGPLLRDAFLHVNEHIYNMAQERPELNGMGTTMNAVLFHGPQLFIANVGDSRTYLINKNLLYQLSRDHSMVQEKIILGMLKREEAKKDLQKNVLVRSVGFSPALEVDVFSYQIMKNDLFLLCSDGLHGKVSERDILHVINQNIPVPENALEKDLDKTAEDLIALANYNGGQDNISLILIIAKE